MRRLLFVSLGFAAFLTAGCAVGVDETGTASDDLKAKSDEAWFYDGPMPMLEQPRITVSLAGSTARLSGLLPDGAECRIFRT